MDINVIQETDLGELLKWNLPVDITDIRKEVRNQKNKL
jgi:hypothetical protein